MIKLDFSQAKVQAIGTVFTAMQVTAKTKTKDQLEEEESIGQTSDTSNSLSLLATNDKNNISPGDNEQTVVFSDPTNGDLVKLNLSNKNIEKLKSNFSNEDFYERKDGSLRLNGEAEAYVSGWFGDIAYKREFLKADADNDGKLSEEEYRNTKNGFDGSGYAQGIGKNVISVTETITEVYESPDGAKPKEATSVETMLDFMLRSDINLNNELSFKEFLGSFGDYRELLLANARKHLENGNLNNQQEIGGNPQTDKDLELLILQSRAAQKLLASNGNESALTAEEREALGAELAIIKSGFKRQKDLKEIKEEVVSKTENTRFLDTVG